MNLATLQVELRLKDCRGRRDRKRRLEEVIRKLRKHFNISATEEEGRDPDSARLFAAAVGSIRGQARESLERAAEALAAHPDLELSHCELRDL